MSRDDLTDAEWRVLKGVLPIQPANRERGRPLEQNRSIIDPLLAARRAASEIQALLPGRSDRRVKIEHGRTHYKQRNRIERMFGHLKINRAIATRYHQLPGSFLGMLHLATYEISAQICPRCLGETAPWLVVSEALIGLTGAVRAQASPDRVT